MSPSLAGTAGLSEDYIYPGVATTTPGVNNVRGEISHEITDTCLGIDTKSSLVRDLKGIIEAYQLGLGLKTVLQPGLERFSAYSDYLLYSIGQPYLDALKHCLPYIQTENGYTFVLASVHKKKFDGTDNIEYYTMFVDVKERNLKVMGIDCFEDNPQLKAICDVFKQGHPDKNTNENS